MDYGLLTFTPYIGDTFVATALARKIYKLSGQEVAVAQIGDENVFTSYFADDTMLATYSGPYTEFLKEGSTFSPEAPLSKLFFKGQFNYFYSETTEYKAKIESLVAEVLQGFTKDEVIHTFHYTYPHAALGREALRRGLTVRGYVLDEGNNLMMINHRGEKVNAVIWTDDFIGTRLARQFLGTDLTIDDFKVNLSPSHIVENKVTILPATRGGGLPSVGHWTLDAEYLVREGYNVEVAWHSQEELDMSPFMAAGANVSLFSSMEAFLFHITSSEFIICNDSSAFHLAWYFGVPAIVKLKGGFNYEWTPEWVAERNDYLFFPPTMMYEEEYLKTLSHMVKDLRFSIRRGPSRRRARFFGEM
jgi:hypothetical protein